MKRKELLLLPIVKLGGQVLASVFIAVEGSTTRNRRSLCSKASLCVFKIIWKDIWASRKTSYAYFFDGMAYRRFAGQGAILCLVTANLYISNLSSLYRPDPWVAR